MTTTIREILFILTFATCCQTLPKTIRVTKAEHCDPIADYPLKTAAKFRTVKGVQYFDFNANYTIPFAYNATIDFHVAVSKNGKNFVHLMSLHEDDVCKFHKKYMGVFYDQILTKLGLQKGQCPVPKVPFCF
ncbi:PREDICTED: uncharacterized protein LOC108561110 [Nicrophorus vespilloides]|uniref:Uncharacterized protein LOC108561110 n=1 Tax=Nicrophorus vespilloides TaxID=110193 RepID=A0ABM1MIJ8_NICVS|nr:PREDICTED: uncharacterized protein LOC108561110 [Nicrophorus vespilloides]